MEKIIRTEMINHVQNNKLFHISQHGFLPRNSCLTNLLTFLDKLTEAIEENTALDIVYLDFAKAFDSVPHERLHQKLISYGFNEQILNWIQLVCFLCNRRQLLF